MERKDVAYGLISVVVGLVLGFFAGNSSSGPSVAGPMAGAGDSASVNGGGGTKLPPGHPATGGQTAAPTGAAQELPAGHPGTDQPATAQPAATAPLELPSLDPLPADNKDLRAEAKYKNIQILKGVPAERLMSIMFAFKSSLGVECTFCHVKDQFDSDDKQNKQVARKMIKMVKDVNGQYIGGMGRVTCFTCHRGQERPAS